MVSWQAHLASFVLRHAFKPRMVKAERVEDMRRAMNTRFWYALPADVAIEAAQLGGVAGEWLESRVRPSANLLLYVHGGGYLGCSPRTHRSITMDFARRGFRTFAPDYRLAPEHSYPAGLADVIAAYRALRRTAGDGAPIVMAGDSAGAGLAVAAMLALRDEGAQLPAAAILFSPFVDLTDCGGSRDRNATRCAMFDRRLLSRFATLYLAGADATKVSPLCADLTGLPPLQIQVGADETLLDDSTRLAERARNDGVPVELSIWPAVPHDWPLWHHLVPEGKRSMARAAEFLGSAIARANEDRESP